MNRTLLQYTYLIVAVLNLISWAWFDGQYTAYTKPLLMPLLMLYMYESSKGGVILGTLLLFLALIFSWGGDLALMYPEDYFLLGVGSFLITQILYIVLFKDSITKPKGMDWLKILCVMIYGGSFFYLLIPNAGELKFPIILYGLTLLTMVATALMRNQHAPDNSYLLIAIGAVFFLVSDTLVAIEKFVTTIPMQDILIMSTYLIAQYLIVEGLIREQQYLNNQHTQNQ